jgi:hypothetical protein
MLVLQLPAAAQHEQKVVPMKPSEPRDGDADGQVSGPGAVVKEPPPVARIVAEWSRVAQGPVRVVQGLLQVAQGVPQRVVQAPPAEYLC